MITPQQFIELLNKWRTGHLSADERELFASQIRAGHYSELVMDILEGHLDAGDLDRLVEVSGQAEGLQRWRNSSKADFPKPVHRVHFLKTAWVRYAAAIIILFGIGAYLWNTTQKKNPQITETKPTPVKNDILPGQDRAVLTLSNGQRVQLNSAASETIKDGTLSIENKDGQLIYKTGEMVAINTMATPKGGQYQLTLADGTKVWLNAASSITYPTAFASNTREVSITGEAYFEVTKNPKQPFIVTVENPPLPTGGTSSFKGGEAVSPNNKGEGSSGHPGSKDRSGIYKITVLGTHFNVNSYEDEESIKTSLLEGSVTIDGVVLTPGQAYTKGKVIKSNVEQDVAWKNGKFILQDKNLKELMRQIARWYDVQVIYDTDVPEVEFVGELQRKLTLSQVLNALEKMSGAHFSLEGRQLRISK